MLFPSRRRLIALAGAALLAACGQSAEAPGAPAAGYVNVYSARHYDSDQRLYDAFTEATGIEVRVLPAPGDQLLERLRTEGELTEADLIVTTDAGNLYRLQEGGLLQAVSTPALEESVPARLRETSGMWWGFSKRARVIAYRKDAVDPAAIASMDALADPRWRGQVCARSSTNIYNLSMLSSRIERLGVNNARQWAQGVRNNFARDPQGGDTQQLQAIAAGECQLAITNHYYYLRMARSEDPAERAAAQQVGLLFPDQQGEGAHVNISGAGVSAYAKRREQAVALLEFLVSRQAQEMLAPLNDEYPIRADVAPTAELAALGAFKEEDVPLDALGRHQAEAARIFDAVGWR